MANNEQVNVPSLLVILALSGLIVRYLFFSTPATTREQQAAARDSSTARNREAAVAQLQQMFPQADRRTLLWDLQRTGGNMTATTERALAGRLETPPQTFQPLPSPSPPVAPTPSQRRNAPAAPAPAAPDLITRYHLQDKLGSPSFEASEPESGKGKAWSANKEERQSLLQRRRDQMILEARRKMEARIAAEKEKAGGTGS